MFYLFLLFQDFMVKQHELEKNLIELSSMDVHNLVKEKLRSKGIKLNPVCVPLTQNANMVSFKQTS